MLEQTLRGQSPIDQWYWDEIEELRLARIYAESELVGALAFGRREDGSATSPGSTPARTPR